MKKYWLKKGLLFLACFIAFALILGYVVMGLWNTILPAVLGVKTITYTQALGLLLLSKILFGGFHGGFRGRKDHCSTSMEENPWDVARTTKLRVSRC